MSDFKPLSEAISKGDVNAAVAETHRALEAGTSAQDILDKGLIATMNQVGDRFSSGQIFVPQMLRSARTMQECVKLLKPHFREGDVVSKGKVLIGTVKGDLHDIGKNLVSMMMEGAGFTIIDLGVDVPPEHFVEKVKEVDPDILGMSALLSTTMPAMADTVDALQKARVRNKVKIMIGGAPVTDKYAQKIGADSYASDAGSAVTRAKELLGIS